MIKIIYLQVAEDGIGVAVKVEENSALSFSQFRIRLSLQN